MLEVHNLSKRYLKFAALTDLSFAVRPAVLAFVILPSLSALILFTQTCFVLLYPNRNDQAQSSIGGFLSLFASLLALFPGVTVGLALHIADAGPVALGLGVTLTNLTASLAALAFATFLWQRFDPTD